MKKPPKRPSIKLILWTDYPAFYASLLVVVPWIVYIAWTPDWRGKGPIIPPAMNPFYLALAILVSMAALCVLVWRIWLLYAIFRKGTQVRGKISAISIRRDRGRVEYDYIFDHKELQSGASIHRTKQTKALKKGDPVILMVDQDKPNRAFIRDLYTSE